MDEKMRMEMAYNLKNMRLQRGWSQAFVSRQLGVSVRSISRAETGRSVSKKLVKRMCGLYGKCPNALYMKENIQEHSHMVTDLIPDEVTIKLLFQSSFISDIQREVVLRIVDVVKQNAVMLREDVEQIVPEIISSKKTYTMADIVSCCMAVNERTIQQIAEMNMA